MSDNQKRSFNPWIPTSILGVVTVLFSFYALQSQTNELEAKKELDRLKTELNNCAQEVSIQKARAIEIKKQTMAACEEEKKLLEESKKSNKKK
jgi:chromosome condensin MukBEF ATPase and DNA-binding subunit MukB